MIIRILLLLSVLTFSSLSAGTTLSEIKEMFDEFNTSPFVNILLIYDTAKPQGVQLEQVMSQIATKRKGYFDVKFLDCNTEDEEVLKSIVYCSGQHREHLPGLMFSEPALNPQDVQGEQPQASMKQYQGPLDDKSLFNFAVPLMKIFSVELKTVKDFNKFQSSYANTPKIIYFTDKEKIPPLYRALTANFRHTIAFAHVFSKSQLAQDLKIEQYPIFMLNGKDKIEVKGNLQQMISRFQMIQGEKTKIEVLEYKTSPIVEINDDNLQKLVFDLPEHTLLHVGDREGNEHPEWVNIQKKFKKMFQLYETTSPSVKESLGVKQTPAIVYFPKSIVKKKVQKTIFNTRHTLANINDEIYEMVDDFTVTLANGLEMQKHTGIHLQDEKFVVVLFHDDKIPLSYKIISNDDIFDDDLVFFRMRNPDPEVIQQFQVKKIPSLFVMMVDKEAEKEPTSEKQIEQGRMNMNLKLATYTGKFVYDDLFNYFSAFSPKAQQKLKESKKSNQDEFQPESADTKLVKAVKNGKKFKKLCLDSNCYLLLINGNKQNQQRNSEAIKTLDEEAFKMAGHNFGYLDAVCHSEILGALEIIEDELPALIYVNSKFQKYGRMVGRVEPKSINSFFGKVRANRAMYRGYEKLQIKDKDCVSEHKKLKDLNEKSADISKEEAEILEELRAEEEKKREEFSKAKTEEKVRKKNKKKRPKKEWEQEL